MTDTNDLLEGFVPTSEEHQRHKARFAGDTYAYQSVEDQMRWYAYGKHRARNRKLMEEADQLPPGADCSPKN
jgi:hypothetical protein